MILYGIFCIVHWSHNLKSKSFVKCEQILTISKDRLIKKIGKINEYDFKEIQKAMNKVIF